VQKGYPSIFCPPAIHGLGGTGVTLPSSTLIGNGGMRETTLTFLVLGSTVAQTGTLERLGKDLVMLRSDDGSMVDVPLSALVEVRLSPGR